jgi:uncharacterized phage-associated protein
MSVVDVAQYILDIRGALPTMKLEKLTYYAQARALVQNKGVPLFDEDFQAWRDGPVCPELYDLHRGKYSVRYLEGAHPDKLTLSQRAIIEETLRAYAGFSGDELSGLTHREEPWVRARVDATSNERTRNVITKSAMRWFYETRLINAPTQHRAMA